MPILWILLGLGAVVALTAKASASETPAQGGQAPQGSGGPAAPSTKPEVTEPTAPAPAADVQWFVPAIYSPTGTDADKKRNDGIVAVLKQVSASKLPLLVSFFLRRSGAPSAKALGGNELLAYGLVKKVTGDGDDRSYEVAITSFAAYEPGRGVMASSAPGDAPSIGSVFRIKGNDLASISEYGTKPAAPAAAPAAPDVSQCKKAVDSVSSVKGIIDTAVSLSIPVPGKEEIDKVILEIKILLDRADSTRDAFETKINYLKWLKNLISGVPLSGGVRDNIQSAIDCVTNIMNQRFGS